MTIRQLWIHTYDRARRLGFSARQACAIADAEVLSPSTHY